VTAPTDLSASASTDDEGAPGAVPGDPAAHENPPEGAGFGPETFRRVFRRHPAGVAVITADAGDGPAGFTVSSLASVSLEPPLLSFGVSTAASVWPTLREATHVGVHLIGERQHELAATFARRGADRFAPPTRWARGPYGIPLLVDVPAWLAARIVALVPAGDHRVVIAEALAGDPDGPGRPLVYHQGRYARLDTPGA
jgi:flavin reductase (DIM6/NTAB) family NADH-FMN oxidoreductase RutF